MELNGYKIRNAIQEQTQRRSVLAAQFRESLKKFDDEEKEHPANLMEVYMACENAITALQVIQTQYNWTVKVKIHGKETKLLTAIKLIGGYGRIEKMWRTAAPKYDRYSDYGEGSRSKDTIYAKDQMSPAQILEASKAASKECAAIREAIAIGNSTPMEFDVDPSLFS